MKITPLYFKKHRAELIEKEQEIVRERCQFERDYIAEHQEFFRDDPVWFLGFNKNKRLPGFIKGVHGVRPDGTITYSAMQMKKDGTVSKKHLTGEWSGWSADYFERREV